MLIGAVATWLGDVGVVSADVFVTARGARVDLPAIADLSCAQMRDVLDAIDSTGYRGPSPKPEDPADMPLLAYEHRLSDRYFSHCLHSRVMQSRPEEAFRNGYRP